MKLQPPRLDAALKYGAARSRGIAHIIAVEVWSHGELHRAPGHALCSRYARRWHMDQPVRQICIACLRKLARHKPTLEVAVAATVQEKLLLKDN